MLKNPFMDAIYIKAQEHPSEYFSYDPLPMFRKEFEITEDIQNARIYVQSPGFACYYINGKNITEDIFISAISDYSKILWYNTYDVTPFLQKGKNVIGVIPGNGFFNESMTSAWDYDKAPWRDAPQFMLSLFVNDKKVLVSDNTFRFNREDSPIIFSQLRSGEYYDARKADDSWMFVGFDDSHWNTAIERKDTPSGELRLTPCQPVREVEVIEPVSITRVDNGFLVDFGVNISGYMEITLTVPRNSEITFRYCEEVDEYLNPKHNKLNRACYYYGAPFQVNKLFASGGVDTFKPKFSYHGFRYVLIEGLRYTPKAETMRAYFTHQDVERRSAFDSGNEVLNYIYNAGIRSTYSNLFWSLTDCPTREKLGWANDAQASLEQTLINFDIVPLYEKWFEDLKSSMNDKGALPGIIPSSGWGFDAGPICDGLLFEMPYRIYLYTGNSKMLVDAIPYFERYCEFLSGELAAGNTFTYGDWMGYACSKVVPKQFVWEFYLMKALYVTAFAHKIAGTDYENWQARYEHEKEAFLNRYLDVENRCIINEQSSLAMILMTDLYRDREVIKKQLVAAVERDELSLTSGMVGVQYLYHALSACGRGDLAYKMITETEPGYKTWFKNGATTLWERWDGKDNESHNHHMFAGIISWFYRSLLGIEPTEEHVGFTQIDLHPIFLTDLGHVKGSMDTVRGPIEAGWSYQNGNFHYIVTIPEGIQATFRGQTLKAGQNKFLVSVSEV